MTEPCERGKNSPPGQRMCGQPSEHVVLSDNGVRINLCDECFIWAMNQGLITEPYIGIGE